MTEAQRKVEEALANLKITLGPNALEMAKNGAPLHLSGGERREAAELVIAALRELRDLPKTTSSAGLKTRTGKLQEELRGDVLDGPNDWAVVANSHSEAVKAFNEHFRYKPDDPDYVAWMNCYVSSPVVLTEDNIDDFAVDGFDVGDTVYRSADGRIPFPRPLADNEILCWEPGPWMPFGWVRPPANFRSATGKWEAVLGTWPDETLVAACEDKAAAERALAEEQIRQTEDWKKKIVFCETIDPSDLRLRMQEVRK